VLSDIRLAFRSLARTPAFAAVIVITLALGIGANTAIFSFFHSILSRDLPYAAADRVVIFKQSATDYGELMGADIGLLAADLHDLQTSSQTVEDLAAYTLDAPTLTGRGAPDLVVGTVVSHNFFSMLGAQAAMGRVFTPADAASSATGRLITISHRLWQTRLGGDPAILGQVLLLNKVPFTVVGVMPADFEYPRAAWFWATPAAVVPEMVIGLVSGNDGGRGHYLRTILGRLRPGVSREQAEKELAALVERLPNPNQSRRAVHLVSMRDQSVGNVRLALTALLGCVGLVLLIACFNVANLMLSRATARQREIGIRLALGSGRWRLARQMLSESLVLALLGGLAGVLLSVGALDLLVRLAPDDIPRLATVHIDGAVLGFALLISVVTGLACGLVPVFGTTRTDLVTVIKSGGDRGGSASAAPRRLRTGLVVGEVAISLILLVAAGLLLRSLEKMQAVSWGFNPAQVVSARVTFIDERYNNPAAQRLFFRTLLEKFEAVPGFEAVGLSLDRIGQTWVHLPFIPEGHTYAIPADAPQANYHFISPDYLRTMGIAVVQGRGFTMADDEKADGVILIDAALAKKFFPDGQAVGKRLGVQRPQGIHHPEIVGVVATVKSDGPVGEARPEIYRPLLQAPFNSCYINVRTSLGVAAAGELFKKTVQQIDAGVPLAHLTGMEQIVAQPGDARRFPLGLLGVFAALALLLAGLGIYAVTAYGVAQRTREIGVRMALGASPASVVLLVLRQGFRPIFLGLVVGMIGAVFTAFALRNLLFGVQPLDLATFAVIPLVLTAFALLACWLPARKAARVNPLEALRAE
jgi:predicted permease